jgi:hypothetical protein
MAIPEDIIEKYNTLRTSFKRDKVVLMEAISKQSGATVYLICATDMTEEEARKTDLEVTIYPVAWFKPDGFYDMVFPPNGLEWINTKKGE